MFLATGTFTVFRGESVPTEYGDVKDQDIIVAEGLKGSVIENRRAVYNPNEGRSTTVRILTGRFNYDTDIQDGDRIKDEKSGVVYLVDSVWLGNSPVHRSDQVVDLQLIS